MTTQPTTWSPGDLDLIQTARLTCRRVGLPDRGDYVALSLHAYAMSCRDFDSPGAEAAVRVARLLEQGAPLPPTETPWKRNVDLGGARFDPQPGDLAMWDGGMHWWRVDHVDTEDPDGLWVARETGRVEEVARKAWEDGTGCVHWHRPCADDVAKLQAEISQARTLLASHVAGAEKLSLVELTERALAAAEERGRDPRFDPRPGDRLEVTTLAGGTISHVVAVRWRALLTLRVGKLMDLHDWINADDGSGVTQATWHRGQYE